ncbi:hypothetical protein [Thiohalorhabdus sp.]|uniref:hypothetical protein n=1 Tax=Thiohalorhabdus sp. TaxID=3094134 RepID=UPI002FC29FD7
MDNETNRPLTPEEAKERLREVASEVGVTPWIRRHPVTVLAGSVSIGYLVGSLSPRERRKAGSLLARVAFRGIGSLLN